MFNRYLNRIKFLAFVGLSIFFLVSCLFEKQKKIYLYGFFPIKDYKSIKFISSGSQFFEANLNELEPHKYEIIEIPQTKRDTPQIEVKIGQQKINVSTEEFDRNNYLIMEITIQVPDTIVAKYVTFDSVMKYSKESIKPKIEVSYSSSEPPSLLRY